MFTPSGVFTRSVRVGCDIRFAFAEEATSSEVTASACVQVMHRGSDNPTITRQLRLAFVPVYFDEALFLLIRTLVNDPSKLARSFPQEAAWISPNVRA